MISRVAEHCFWLSRYIERAGTTARFVAVNCLAILDAHIHDAERWKPVVVVSGVQQRFEELLDQEAKDGRETETLRLAQAVRQRLSGYDPSTLSGPELHKELTHVISAIEAIGEQAAVDYAR